MKKLMPLLLILCTLLLSACGLFDSSYVVESDYALPTGKENDTGDALNVSNLSELREAVRSIVARGGENQSILFASQYNGVPTEDLASAIWQVRSAMFAALSAGVPSGVWLPLPARPISTR